MDHMTGNPEIDQWISLFGALVPAASMIAGILNQRIRDAQLAGTALNPLMLSIVSALNIFAINFDKAMQLAKLAKELRTGASAPAEEPKA